MTNMEFYNLLCSEFEKYPMLNFRFKKSEYSFNELTYVLRRSGRDFCVTTIDPYAESGFGIVPSVAETFIPSRDLARMVKKIEYDEPEDSELGCLVVEFESEKKRKRKK